MGKRSCGMKVIILPKYIFFSECPPAADGMERFACPTPDRQGRYRCIDDHVLCDGFIDCPSGEDEDRQACMFYKTVSVFLVVFLSVFEIINIVIKYLSRVFNDNYQLITLFKQCNFTIPMIRLHILYLYYSSWIETDTLQNTSKKPANHPKNGYLTKFYLSKTWH